LKTLQEGLCADAILKAADPVAVLRHLACADVAGVERVREDMEMTIDLVFEHADRSTRRTLRALDETRWARTVVTNGTEQDAREALEVVHTLHMRRGVAYGIFGDGALRSSRQMVAAIGTRWPAVIGERREELEADARSADATDRLRALETLAALEPDEYTEGWLLPRLDDEEPRVIEQAVATAGRMALMSAERELWSLLDSKESRVRKRARAALVEIVDVDGLVEVGTRAARVNGLQPIFERLLERLDLDHGIELVRQAGLAAGGGLAALLQRLPADAPREAWTERRVKALMLACANLGAVGVPEAELLAAIFARHPDAALEGVRVQRVGEGPWGPLGQLVPLSAACRKSGGIGRQELCRRPGISVVMARPTPRIVLSAEERCELEHVAACYTRPHQEVQRAKLVLYAADGEPNVEIGRRLDMNPDVVGRWRKRFAEERLEGLKDRPRAGRPRRFPPGRGRAGQGGRVRAASPARHPALALQ